MLQRCVDENDGQNDDDGDVNVEVRQVYADLMVENSRRCGIFFVLYVQVRRIYDRVQLSNWFALQKHTAPAKLLERDHKSSRDSNLEEHYPL